MARSIALAIGLTVLAAAFCGCLGLAETSGPEKAARKAVSKLAPGQRLHVRLSAEEDDFATFQVSFDTPVALDVTLPTSDRGRTSSYRLKARGVTMFNVAIHKPDDRVLGIGPEWIAPFELIEAHWIGPDLGFPPAGGG